MASKKNEDFLATVGKFGKFLLYLGFFVILLLVSPWIIDRIRNAFMSNQEKAAESQLAHAKEMAEDKDWRESNAAAMGIDLNFLRAAERIKEAFGLSNGWLGYSSLVEDEEIVRLLARQCYDYGDQRFGEGQYDAWASIQYCYEHLVLPGRSLDNDFLKYMDNESIASYHPVSSELLIN